MTIISPGSSDAPATAKCGTSATSATSGTSETSDAVGTSSDYRLFGAFGEADLVSGEGFGRRGAARFIDALVFLAVQFIVTTVVSLPVAMVASMRGLPVETIQAAFNTATPVAYVAAFVANFAYFVAFEWLWGTTPGKRVLGLAVVSEDLERCTFGAALRRNLLYLLEALAWGVPAFFAMRNSARAQRHGDRWARTIVPRRAHVPAAALGTTTRFLLSAFVVLVMVTAAAAVRLPGQIGLLRAAQADTSTGLEATPDEGSLGAVDPHAAPGDLYATGLAAFRRKDYQVAIDQWVAHLAANTADEKAWYGLGLAYSETADWGNAANAFSQLLKRAPRHPRAWYAAGWVLEGQRQPDEAIKCYRNQIVVTPGHGRAHKRLGLLLFERNEWKEAESMLQRASTIIPADAEIDLALGRARLKQHDTAGAVEAFERLRSRQDTSFGQLSELAQHLADEGVALDRADQWAGEAVESAARESMSLAIETLTTADTMRSWAISWMWYGRGRVALAAGDLPKAERYLRAAHSFRASSVIVRDLGIVVEKAGHRADAALLYGESLLLSEEAGTRSLLRAAGVPDAGMAAAVNEARRRRGKRHMIGLGKGAIPGGFADVLLLFTNGRPGPQVRAVTPDSRLDALLVRAETAVYPVQFPDDTPAQVACWGRLMQDPGTGECVLAIAMGIRPLTEK